MRAGRWAFENALFRRRTGRQKRRSKGLRVFAMARRPTFSGIAAICVAILLAVWTAPTWAQQAEAPAKKAQSKGKGDQSGLAKRMTQLEEQIVDLQVVIGTLQTLVRRQDTPGDYQQAPSQFQQAPTQDVQPQQTAGPSGGAPTDVGMRITVIETQIQALTGQIEQLSQRLQQLQSGGTGGFGTGQGSQPPTAPPDDNLGRLMR